MSQTRRIRPFIRWAGGKQYLIDKINKYIPQGGINKYFEPFLGAGSMYFSNDFDSSYLSDINVSLINSYQAIKENPLLLSSYLESFRNKVSSPYYYSIRDDYNNKLGSRSIIQSARFIFLIHTSFNGIYRVNKQGKYNVPVGKLKPFLPTKQHLLDIHQKLMNANLEVRSYEEILPLTESNDFVYLDPPYPPLNGTSAFQHYTTDKFPQTSQEQVAIFADRLGDKGVRVAISNADLPIIRDLYKKWEINQLETTRYISCKAKKHKVNEIIIKNY